MSVERVGRINASSFARLIKSEEEIGRKWLEILNDNPRNRDAATAVHDSAVRLADLEAIYAVYFHYPDEESEVVVS